MNVYRRDGIDSALVKDAESLRRADALILPGVGAFDQVMGELNASGMRPVVERWLGETLKPVLGICVGMQLLANGSDEGSLPGLGWIDGRVKKFDHDSFTHATHLPHMGWNTVAPRLKSPLFDGVDLSTGYYFLHSYYFSCSDPQDELATTAYGIEFASAVCRGNVFGVQFHPEKSHEAGVRLLRNFASMC
jgi:imidazole glycerol-phosphate synthase subunit HisH